jgi:hypothetical protein
MFGHTIPASDTTNQQRFAYPLYSVLLFAPFALLPFSAAQAFAFAAATGPHDPIRVLVATATNNRQDKNNPGDIPPGELSRRAWPAQLRQPTMLIAPLLAAAVFCVRSNRLVRAGCLAAISTSKPQLAIAVILPLLVWALAE